MSTKPDQAHCDVFLTNDHEMSREKRIDVEALLGGTRIVEPATFIAELSGSGCAPSADI